MKYISVLYFSLILCCINQPAFAQQKLPEGYFTSEAITTSTGNETLISIKKYNPTQSEIDNAAMPYKNGPMNYMMIPFEYVKISMYGKVFESKLYSLNKEGNVVWDKTMGYSENSTPGPVKFYKDFIFTGGSDKNEDKVRIQKIDTKGKIIWQTELDSLHNVNDIFVEGNQVSALVSFNVIKQLSNSDGTFTENVYPIYFFVQLDITSGKILKKEYQSMGNYLSSLNYSNPFLNSDYSYYLNNKDSAIFLNVMQLGSAMVVSQDMSKENSILQLTAGKESYHLLTELPIDKNKKVYNLISNFYGKKKNYETKLPLEFSSSDRRFIYKTQGDSVLAIIGNPENISIAFIDIEGKYSLYKKIENNTNPVIGGGMIANKVYVIQMEGRNKPGSIGRIKISYY